MSYILDALTRSDQERQRGTVPDLHTVHALADAERPRDAHWIYVGAAVLIFGAIVIAAWMHARSAATSGRLAQLVAGQQDANSVDRGKMAIATNPAAAPEPAREDRPVTVTPPQRVAKSEPSPAPRPTAPDELHRKAQGDSPHATVPVEPQRKAVRKTTPGADAKRSPDAAPAAPGPVPAVASAAASGQTGVPPPPDKRVFNMSELPSTLQRELPPISISGYARSNDAKDRMVVINERVVQEGDELATGLKVEEIAPNGVTFSYKGYRFRSLY